MINESGDIPRDYPEISRKIERSFADPYGLHAAAVRKPGRWRLVSIDQPSRPAI